MNGLVSIITPVYNRKSLISDCVASALNQTYKNIEIIIVDDGSDDGTYDVCIELAAKDDRIKLFKSEHLCVSGARNIALDNCSGEFVFFLDSDDVIHPKTIEALVEGMRKNNASISGSGIQRISENNWDKRNEIIAQDTSEGDTELVSNANAINLMFRKITPINLIGGVMFKRDYIENTRFKKDLFIGEDFYFIYENLIKGSDVVFLKPLWYYCRIHSGSISNNYNYDAFWTRFYRRVLVWKSEESFGRKDNAILQKRDAFSCYMRCAAQIESCSDDAIRMRRTLKEYKNDLLGAFTFKGKIMFILVTYFPRMYRFLKKSGVL